MTETTERGAHTIRMPEGDGFAIAIFDEAFPDRIVRHVSLMKVAPDDSDVELHEHTEVIWRSANPA